MISRFTTCFNGSREYQVFIQNWLLCLWKDRWSSFSSSYLSSLLCLFHFWYIEQFVFYWSMFWIFPCSKNPIRRSKSIFEESWKRRCHWFFKCNCSWWRIIDGNKIRKAVFLLFSSLSVPWLQNLVFWTHFLKPHSWYTIAKSSILFFI